MIICFIGHRKVENKEIKESLTTLILSLIDKGADTFLFGSKSEFDSLSWEVVTKIRHKFPTLKRVYIRSYLQ